MEERDGMEALAAAVRQADDERVGPVMVPSFDTLLGRRPELAGRRTRVAGPSLRRSWRLVGGLVPAQARLMPRSLGPLTAAGLGAGIMIARTAPTPGAVDRLFGTVVTAVLLIGVITACSRRSDPRLELLSAMPVSPATAFSVRLTLVLGLDLALAVAASAVLTVAGGTGGLAMVVAGWLGRGLLAAGMGAVCAVWRSPALGSTAGIMVWLAGWLLAPHVAALSGLHPWMAVCALLLLAMAVRLARRPRLSGQL